MDVGRLRIIIICDAKIYVFSIVELHWQLLNFRGVSFIHLSRRRLDIEKCRVGYIGKQGV